MLDLLIVNGRYPDYEKDEFVEANIGIENGKIVYIGGDKPETKEEIDANGHVVSPGFIDIHMHEEILSQTKGEYSIANFMLKQGVTLAVGGNCGLSRQTVKEFKEFINSKGGSPCNYMLFSGYNTYRQELVPNHYAQTSMKVRDKIREKMKADIDEGAVGISFGIEYDPGITYEELIYAVEVDPNPNLLVAAHYRNDCLGNIDSVQEMIRIQSNINKKFEISHLSSCSAQGTMKESLEAIDKAMKEDPRLNFDTYPYNAFCTDIGSTVFDDGCFEEWGKDYSDVMLLETPYKNVRCTKEIFEDARKNYPDMLCIGFVMNEDEIAMAVCDKNGMIGSDGEMTEDGGHPRCAGTFPRVLGKYVREDKLISLIDALKKLTIVPASRIYIDGIKGQIVLGADADITIFDPDTIIDGAVFGDAMRPNKGIDYVIVNGKVALHDNEIINGRAGKFVCRKND